MSGVMTLSGDRVPPGPKDWLRARASLVSIFLVLIAVALKLIALS